MAFKEGIIKVLSLAYKRKVYIFFRLLVLQREGNKNNLYYKKYENFYWPCPSGIISYQFVLKSQKGLVFGHRKQCEL